MTAYYRDTDIKLSTHVGANRIDTNFGVSLKHGNRRHQVRARELPIVKFKKGCGWHRDCITCPDWLAFDPTKCSTLKIQAMEGEA